MRYSKAFIQYYDVNGREQNRLMCYLYDNARRSLIYVMFVDNGVMRFVITLPNYYFPTLSGHPTQKSRPPTEKMHRLFVLSSVSV